MDGRISNLQQVANLRRYTLTEGREKGLDVIDCDNGKIRFLLNVSKALDVMQVYHQGQNVSFLSKNAFTGRESHFLNRFEGGMIYTCGLDSAGGRDGYELHGTLHNIPAEVVCAKCTETEIVVEALVRDTALFGKNLMLRRRVASVIGSNTFTLEDTLVNNGYKAEDYCLLYHVNVGYPMLDDGVKINLSEVSCEPRTAWAKENEGSRYEITAPTPGMEETCYFLKLKTGKVEVINEKLAKTLTLEYSLDTLPCFVEWKSMASGDYALGIEPSTTELDDRFAYKSIAAGEEISFRVSITIA